MKARLICLIMFLSTPAAGINLIDTVKAITALTVGRYEKFELGVHSEIFSAPFYSINQYDPDDIDMYAIFTSPSGNIYRRTAFWFQDFSRCNKCTNHVTPTDRCQWIDSAHEIQPPDPNAYLTPNANNEYPWRVRFSPPEIGRWTYVVIVRSVLGADTSDIQSFVVTNSAHKGFIKVDTTIRKFKYRNTDSVFIPIGLNAIRPHAPDTPYNRIRMSVVTEMAQQITPFGGNFLRIWMGPDNLGIEWKDGKLGRYDARQHIASDLDSVINKAEDEDVYLQVLVMEQHDIRQKWADHPYNIANRGFISDPDEFFTDVWCIKAFRQRLRYIIARWGYSPNILGFELMQEIDLYGDGTPGSGFYDNFPNVYRWYQDMIRYCRTMDSLHLYTVSTGGLGPGKYNGSGALFNMPELDYLNVHFYGGDFNVAYQVNYEERMAAALFPTKPMFYGEIGINWGNIVVSGKSFTDKMIYEHPEWHNFLWSTAFSGSAGPGLWWGEFPDIVHPEELYPGLGCWGGQYKYFLPLKKFMDEEPIYKESATPIANKCTGRGAVDARWFLNNPSSRYDNLTRDSCGCFQPANLFDTARNPLYIGSGIVTTRDSLIEVFGLKTSNRAIGWIHNKLYYWYELPHAVFGDANDASQRQQVEIVADSRPDVSDIPTIDNDSVTIEGLTAGSYHLTFYSTWPDLEVDNTVAGAEYGGVIPSFSDTVLVGNDGLARFKIPPLKPLLNGSVIYAPDYGFKLKPE